jgi:hypothetical protein
MLLPHLQYWVNGVVMGIFSKLIDVFKAIIKKVVKAIVDGIKKYWPILLAIAVVAFAPQISFYLQTAGFPSSFVSAFSWIGTTITPTIVSVKTGTLALMKMASSSFMVASLGTQAAIIGGTMLILAPEETTELIEESISVLTDVVTSVVSGIVSGVSGGLSVGKIFFGAMLGFAGYKFATAERSRLPTYADADIIMTGDQYA